MNTALLEVIKQLELEINNKQLALNELYKMAGIDSTNITFVKPDYDSPFEVKTSSLNESFPKNGRKDQKIVFLFNNVIDSGVVMSEVQSVFDKYNGSNDNVSNIVRRLKEQGVLSAVKYNNQNKLTFWGLSNWINESKNDFKDEFKPNKNKLPLEIKLSEVIGLD